MSTFSFETISDDYKLLVSPTALNLHLAGSAEYAGPGSSMASSYYTINCTSRPLVFATLGYGDAGCIIDVTEIATGVWSIETLGSPGPICFAALTNEAPRSEYGLRILREDGRVAFDSTRCPLYLTHAIQIQYPAGTPFSSMKVSYPSGVITPFVTAYSFAMANGPNPPVDDSGHPIGVAGVYMLGLEDVGDGWSPLWLEYREGDTGYPPNSLPSAVDFTILIAEGNGVE